MRRLRRVPFRVIVPVVLMVVLAVLAALQYRWLGQVSLAERQRMHETMTARAEALASDIDRELSWLYLTFQLRQPDADRFEQALAERHKLWRERARHPELIEAIYSVTGSDMTLQRFDPSTATLTPTEWPEHLKPIRERTLNSRTGSVQTSTASAGGQANQFTFRLPAMISTDPLAVSVVVPFITYSTRNGVTETRVAAAPGSLLIAINQKKFLGEIIPQLVTQHLGDSLDEYRLAIVKTRTPAERVFVSGGDTSVIDPEVADVNVGALGVRPAINDRLLATELQVLQRMRAAQQPQGMPPGGSPSVVVFGQAPVVAAGHAAGVRTQAPPSPPPAPPANATPDRFSVVIEQSRTEAVARQVSPSTPASAPAAAPRGSAPSVQPQRVGTMAGGIGTLGTGSWRVLLKHRAGSLEAAVQKVRRRNLLMSFGMLTLLGASVALVLVSARRAERLASQQMDFVATVSHELRTPLAVIRSAGQNLAAGVVQDPRRYGDLIETEGRRLTDMVEQTLALAGLSGDRKPMAQTPIDTGDLVRAVLASPETSARADGVSFDVRIAEELPLVLADEMLLRRGVQNLVGNALKYGANGGWLGVTVDAAGSRRGREVRITISDRGPGVAAEDLPHIFEAFYRGRKAVAEQVQGNGLGLHLVKRIAEAHGGRITVRTAPGEGAAFTLHIPARADLAVHTFAGQQPQTS